MRVEGDLASWIFSENLCSIQVENHNEVQAVLDDLKLMRHAALSGYCSTHLKLIPVNVVIQSVILHLSWNIGFYFTMHT